MTAGGGREFLAVDRRLRPALAGLAAVAGNLAGVAFLRKMPSAYRLARLDEWSLAVREQRGATVASALCFAMGLVGLAAWATELGRSTGTTAARHGASLIAVTASLNALGSLLPIAAALRAGACDAPCEAVGVGLLRAALTVDALFNLGLGVGLVSIAWHWRGVTWLRVLALVAGAVSVPVAGQFVWDPAASLLYFAAPLWLTFILVTSIGSVRLHVREAR